MYKSPVLVFLFFFLFCFKEKQLSNEKDNFSAQVRVSSLLVLLPGRDALQLEELSLMCVLLCLFLTIAVLFAVVFSPQLFTYIF